MDLEPDVLPFPHYNMPDNHIQGIYKIDCAEVKDYIGELLEVSQEALVSPSSMHLLIYVLTNMVLYLQ